MEDRQFKHLTEDAGQSCPIAEEGLTPLSQIQVFGLKALANCFASSPATPSTALAPCVILLSLSFCMSLLHGFLRMFPLTAVASNKGYPWNKGNRAGTSRVNFALHSILPQNFQVLHHSWRTCLVLQHQPDLLPLNMKSSPLTISFTLIFISSISAILFQRPGMHQHLECHIWRRWLRPGSNKLGEFVYNVADICFFTWLGRRVGNKEGK